MNTNKQLYETSYKKRLTLNTSTERADYLRQSYVISYTSYTKVPLTARADYRIIRLLAKREISKLSLQVIQPKPATYKRSYHPTQTVSLLLAMDEATCPGWKKTLLSMCFISLATESQQQRQLRGMTIIYIMQPTFEPGLNPWGVYFLINVIPASATFRRVLMPSYVQILSLIHI